MHQAYIAENVITLPEYSDGTLQFNKKKKIS